MRSKHLLGIIVFTSVLVTTLLSGSAYAITNGQPDVGNDWPYVGLVVVDEWNGTDVVPMWRGTGSLISPTVVLTAGHLTENALGARIWFNLTVKAIWEGPPGHYPFPGPDAVEAVTIETCPGYAADYYHGIPSFITNDVGILVLGEEVSMPGGEYGQLPDLNQVDTLRMMEVIDQVGYGVQWVERPCPYGPYYHWMGFRMRHFAPANLVSDRNVISDGFMKLTANPANGKGGTAFGDSGGPNLLHGTNTILGVTSWGTNDNCAGVSYVQRVDTADVLSWINGFLDS